MALEAFTLATLADMDGGRIRAAFELALRRVKNHDEGEETPQKEESERPPHLYGTGEPENCEDYAREHGDRAARERFGRMNYVRQRFCRPFALGHGQPKRETMTEQQQQDKKPGRTITLTGRAPVRIVEQDWPVIASAADDNETRPGQSYQYSFWGLRVRRHADGRVLVYTWIRHQCDAAWGNPPPDGMHVGGRVFGVPVDDLARMIAEVGDECGAPDSLVRACVADLPAEEL